MKIRSDVVKMYKEVHGWVGIISGLALFVAFYAGAITMFEEPLQRWASPPAPLAAPVPLSRAPELVAKVLAAHPEAAKGYDVNVVTDGNRPARMSWSTGGRGRGPRTTYHAALDANGALQVTTQAPSPVGEFVDVLHQQVGLPFSHTIAMPIMGAIALLYAIAIVSGTVVLLPSLVSDLFAVRVGKNVKRMWLDVHNVLGLFSLPFHLIMALTAIVFAFHDQFYGAQGIAFGGAPRRGGPEAHGPPPPAQAPLSPVALVAALERGAPGFVPVTFSFHGAPGEALEARVSGRDARYGVRGPTDGGAEIDPYTGRITDTVYMPGHQDGWSATVTSFFTLHFGSFGGAPVRWAYFLLGLAGALLFYTGNLLWVESRRKKERKAGLPEQTRATRVLGALTVGVPLGCIAGISATVAAAKLIGAGASYGLHSAIYYAVFLAFTAYALARGAARSGVELSVAAGVATLLVPLASLIASGHWRSAGDAILVDLVALAGAGVLLLAMRSARYRAQFGARDSVWSAA